MTAMKPLPTLSLDCRDKTIEEFAGLNQLPIIVAATDVRVAIVTADPDGHFDLASQLVDRANAYEELVQRLRFFAIVETQKPLQNKYDGFRCRCCGSTWKFKQPETHNSVCVLRGTGDMLLEATCSE